MFTRFINTFDQKANQALRPITKLWNVTTGRTGAQLALWLCPIMVALIITYNYIDAVFIGGLSIGDLILTTILSPIWIWIGLKDVERFSSLVEQEDSTDELMSTSNYLIVMSRQMLSIWAMFIALFMITSLSVTPTGLIFITYWIGYHCSTHDYKKKKSLFSRAKDRTKVITNQVIDVLSPAPTPALTPIV